MKLQIDTYDEKFPLKSRALDPLETAICSTVAYGDIFSFAPTFDEIVRYLHFNDSPAEKVRDTLNNGELLLDFLSTDGRYFCLVGREGLFETRRKREALSGQLWESAERFRTLLSSFPFVRMIGVTGSLAVNNANDAGDFDVMLITEGGKLWRVRALSKLAQMIEEKIWRRHRLCINYFRSTAALAVDTKRLHIARDLTQMVPIYGQDVYDAFRRENEWVLDYLPNAKGPPRNDIKVDDSTPLVQPLIEAVSGWPLGEAIERWESKRKIYRYNETDFLEGRWSTFSKEATGHRLWVGDQVEATLARTLAQLA